MLATVDALGLQGFSQLSLLLLFLLGICFGSSLLGLQALLKESHQINEATFDHMRREECHRVAVEC